MQREGSPGVDAVGEEVLRAYVAIQKLVANEGRLRILVALSKGPRTWSELMFESRINPKSLRDNLELLIESGLVQKEGTAYSSTDAGLALTSMSLTQMVETAKFATTAASIGATRESRKKAQ